MRIRTLVAGAVAGLAGLAGAVVGYQQIAAPDPSAEVSTTEVAAMTDVSSPAPEPSVAVRYEKCPRGFELRAGACVREVERTVVVEVAPPAPARVGTPAPAGTVSDDHGDDGDDGDDPGDDRGDDVDENESDDHADEDHEDHEDEADEDEDHEDEDHGEEDEDHEDEDHGEEDD